MMEKLYVEIQKDQIDLYLSHPQSGKNVYMKYRLKHLVIPFLDGGTRQNQDLWRLYELYACEKTTVGMRLLSPEPLVNRGEWEAAVKVENTPDFHGGYHGYERLIRVEITADGKEISLVENQAFWAEEFTFLQESDLILQGTEREKLAHHLKKYRFSKGELQLEQELVWSQSVKVPVAYLAMLPIRRTADDTDAGLQITDRVSVNGGPDYDVSCIGHRTPVSSGSPVTDFRSATIWGETSGLVAQMKVSGAFPPSNRFMVQNTPAYNKLYFSYANNHQTEVGEKWALQTTYSIYQKIGKS